MAIILLSPMFREYLFLNKDTNLGIFVLHFIITSPTPELTLFPWIAVCFISSIFGEYLYEAMIDGSIKAYMKLFKLFMFWAIILMVVGSFFLVLSIMFAKACGFTKCSDLGLGLLTIDLLGAIFDTRRRRY